MSLSSRAVAAATFGGIGRGARLFLVLVIVQRVQMKTTHTELLLRLCRGFLFPS